jgi:general secretion pathway protein H
MLIIGILLRLATLAVDSNPARVLEQEAQRLAALLTLARQEALLQGQEMGVAIETTAYQFYLWQDSGWQLLKQDDLFHPQTLPTGLQAALSLDETPLTFGVTPTEKPHLLLLSSGEITPFKITLNLVTTETPRYDIQGDLLGHITYRSHTR